MKKAIIVSLVLVTLTAIGSVNMVKAVPYIVIGAVIAVIILVALGKIKPREYPIYIFGLSLALVWQTSMLGHYIVGVDVHTEMYVARQAVANGWDIHWANNNNSSAVLGILVPLFAKLQIDPTWQFKIIYPFILALTPVILYFAYRGMIGEKRAAFACLFFLTIPMFFVEAVSMAKSTVAYTFLALAVWFICSNIKQWKKASGIALTVAGTVMCHYSVSATTMLILIGAFIILLILQVPRFKGILGQSKLSFRYLGVTVGISFAIFRILQYLTQLLLVTGFFVMVFRRKQYNFNKEYGACVVASFGLLGLCLFVPRIASIMSTTRFYMITLFFLAPMLVIGIEGLNILRIKRTSVVICTLLICYYAFTSGLIFEVTKDTVLDKVNVPYSVSLSNDRVAIVTIPSEGDWDCIKWIAHRRPEALIVWLDYCSSSLLLEENYGIGASYNEPSGAHYLYLSSWDTQHNQIVFGKSPGFRIPRALPDLDNYRVIFRRGDAVIYRSLQ